MRPNAAASERKTEAMRFRLFTHDWRPLAGFAFVAAVAPAGLGPENFGSRIISGSASLESTAGLLAIDCPTAHSVGIVPDGQGRAVNRALTIADGDGGVLLKTYANSMYFEWNPQVCHKVKGGRTQYGATQVARGVLPALHCATPSGVRFSASAHAGVGGLRRDITIAEKVSGGYAIFYDWAALSGSNVYQRWGPLRCSVA